MRDPDDQLELRRQIGIALRFPVVALLALVWVVYLWWWLASIGLAAALVMLVLYPVAYPLLRIFTYLTLAFQNSKEPVLPGYWERYPDRYLDWCAKSLKLGFPTLRRWLLEGFG